MTKTIPEDWRKSFTLPKLKVKKDVQRCKACESQYENVGENYREKKKQWDFKVFMLLCTKERELWDICRT